MSFDRRSVGELLHAADRDVRDALFDCGATRATAHLHGWREVMSAALDVWQALPPAPSLGWRTPQQGGREVQHIADTFDRAGRQQLETSRSRSPSADPLLAGPVISTAGTVERAREASPVDVHDAAARRDISLPWQLRATLMATCARVGAVSRQASSAAHMLDGAMETRLATRQWRAPARPSRDAPSQPGLLPGRGSPIRSARTAGALPCPRHAHGTAGSPGWLGQKPARRQD